MKRTRVAAHHLPDTSVIGETFDGKYKLVRLLGEGGMGAVYEARHTETNRRVALKIIRGDRKDASEDRVRRFQREAKAAGSIDTQHIAQVLDAGKDAARGVPYITLEYLNGEDLDQLLDRVGVLRPEIALRIVGQACIGLVKAHEAGVYHRDIKPANIFLAEREGGEITVKLLDFGIAKMRPENEPGTETTGLTQTGAIMGSPLYMSPEQARSLPSIDYRTDLWSLGVVLYRALAGRAPHEHITTIGGLIFAICAEPAEPIRAVAPWLPAATAEVVHRALQIDPEARFPTATEMLETIKRLLPDGLALRREDLVAFASVDRTQMAALAAAKTELIAAQTPQASDQGVSASLPSESGVRAAKTSSAPLRLGAVLALGLGALGVYKLVSSPSPVRPVGAAETASSNPVVESSAKGAKVSVGPPVEKIMRQVRLQVGPRDAAVEVDGALVAAVDAFVEIKGELGSTHQVRLFKAGREQTALVVIAEDGPVPSKLELTAAPAVERGDARATPGAHRPAASSIRGAAVAPASTAPPAKPTAATPVDPMLPKEF